MGDEEAERGGKIMTMDGFISRVKHTYARLKVLSTCLI